LIVDDEIESIEAVHRIFKNHSSFSFEAARSGFEALDLIKTSEPDLILLDLRLPGLSGIEVCRILKNDERFRLIPIILLTSLSGTDDRVAGIEAGAEDFIVKGSDPLVFLARVRALMRVKLLNERLLTVERAIMALTKAIEAHDPHTRGHTERVVELATRVGDKMGLSDSELQDLRLGAALHDIGKIGVREQILLKPGPLTEEEFEEQVSHHPSIGVDILRPITQNSNIVSIIRHHHEKLDGSGYPDGLSGDEIPLLTRIITVVDIYDALSNERPYHQPLDIPSTIAWLDNEVTLGKLDGQVVAALRRIVSPLPDSV